MPRTNVDLLAFNRGVISPLALARTDVDRTRLSAEVMTNWLPKTQGAMRIRPGTKHVGSSVNDTGAVFVEFVASTADSALLELTNLKMRVWDTGDDLITIPTRATGSSQMTGVSSDTGPWVSDTGLNGYVGFGDTGMVLDAQYRGAVAKATQKVPLGDTGDEDTEFFLDIHIVRGPVTFRCGSDTGLDDFVAETSLKTGYHKLGFTPNDTGGFHLTFQNAQDVDRIVGSLSFGDTGTLEVTTPWATSDLGLIRYEQSADVVYVAAAKAAGGGYKQYQIERRGTGRSWSAVEYDSDNGPFLPKTADVRLKVAQTFGNTTLTADAPFFRTTHVGALFYLNHIGYSWTFNLAGEDVYTEPIRVSGIAVLGEPIDDREYQYKVTGTFSATLNLLHSTEDKEFGPYTATISQGGGTENITDTGTFKKDSHQDNAVNNNLVEYVKVGILPGNYTSGVATVVFQRDGNTNVGYDGGGDYGIVRVTKYNSATSVDCEILRPPTQTEFTNDWREGAWSDAQLWPTAVNLYEGRLWWHGRTYVWGSKSDEYTNFDDAEEGDARPIVRVIGEGPVDNINFAVGLSHLLIGNAGGVLRVKSNSFDEPLTADNMNIKLVTTQGADVLRALRHDNRAIYVQRSGTRAYEILYNVEAGDFLARELTILNPEILEPGVVDIAIQRQPDTRVHFILGDGSVAIFTYEPSEDLVCWSKWVTDTGGSSAVERAAVLPGATEDKVYYHVRRTINGATKRFIERWASEAESIGDTGLSYLSDCAVSFTNDTGLTPTGLDHLEGASVVVWGHDTGTGGGKDLSYDTGATAAPKKYTVSGGSVTLPERTNAGVAGLPFAADWKSTKLAYAAAGGTALTQMKRTDHIGFVLANVHNNGIFFGRDFDNLDPLPRHTDEGAAADKDRIFTAFDKMSMPFPGLWSSDSRIALRAVSPRPVTVMAAIPNVETSDKL